MEFCCCRHHLVSAVKQVTLFHLLYLLYASLTSLKVYKYLYLWLNIHYLPELCSNQGWFKYLMTQIFETNQNVGIWLIKWFELIWKWLHKIWFENICWFELWFLFSPQIRKTFLACNLIFIAIMLLFLLLHCIIVSTEVLMLWQRL